jgi:hypothetical protein
VGPDPEGRSSPSGAPPPHSRRGSVASTAAVSSGNWWASVSVGDAGAYWDDQGSVGSADGSVHSSGSVEGSQGWGGGGGGGGSAYAEGVDRAVTPSSVGRAVDLITVSRTGDLGAAMEALQYVLLLRFPAAVIGPILCLVGG